LEGRKDGLMDLSGAPSAELRTTVKQDFHQAERAGVLYFDAGDFDVSPRDGLGGHPEGKREEPNAGRGEVDVSIEGLGLELSKMVGDGG
jgi:hypothetical protein